MPLTVEEYRIGQLYMIAKHSHEQSEKGEGVEVVTNEPFFHEVHGQVRLAFNLNARRGVPPIEGF